MRVIQQKYKVNVYLVETHVSFMILPKFNVFQNYFEFGTFCSHQLPCHFYSLIPWLFKATVFSKIYLKFLSTRDYFNFVIVVKVCPLNLKIS